ncbi:MAG: DJ-1/PfpI family protein [Planctomycetota bacterium]
MKRRVIFLMAFLAALLLPALGAQAGKATRVGPLNDCRVIIVIAPENFRDEEYTEPRKILEDAGARIIVAADVIPAQTEKGEEVLPECKGMLGLKVRPEVTLAQALEAARTGGMMDAVVFVGGPGAAKYAENAKALELACVAKMRRKIVAAICLAPTILAKAGLLKDRNATVWAGAKDKLKEAGAKYSTEGVVVDGRIITADGPQSSKKFGETIHDILAYKAKYREEADEQVGPVSALIKEQKFAEAHALLDKVRSMGKIPAGTAAGALLARADVYRAEGKNEQSLQTLKEFEKGLDGFRDSDLYPLVVFRTAEMLREMNRKEEAAEYFTKILAMDADDFEEGPDGYRNYHFAARVHLGEIRVEQEKYVEALDSYLAAVHQRYAAFKNSGAEKEMRENCSASAAEAAGKLLGCEPDKEMRQVVESALAAEEYLFALGMLYYNDERNAEAKSVFEKLANHFPDSELLKKIPEDARSDPEPEETS